MTAPIAILLSSACALSYVASIVMAIVAFCTRRGRKGVILRASMALLISSVIFAIAAPASATKPDRCSSRLR